MKQEAKKGSVPNLSRVQERVHQATGVSIRSIQRILKEPSDNNAKFRTPNKKRNRIKPKSDIDDFDLCVFRRTINEFHITHKERPTVKSQLQKDINDLLIK
uniref:Uncharacterized protein n=1 Tax=Cacopsylla melanoneura TaxID=428564 RepID=A0A8D9FCZ7_9HEMI